MVRTLSNLSVVDDSGTTLGTVDIVIDTESGTVTLSNVRPADGFPPRPIPATPIRYFLTPQTTTDDIANAPEATFQIQSFPDGDLHVVAQKDLLLFRLDGGSQTEPPAAPTGPVPPFTPCFRDATGKLFDPTGNPLT